MTGQQLKNSILQMAIQGKLVPQDPHDEPASVLLERIREEKKRLVKEGVLKKKDLEETPISEEEIPFDIPEGWVWCRISQVIYPPKYGTSNKSLATGSVPVLRMGNIQNGEIVFDKLVYSNNEDDNAKYNLIKGDLLFNRTNSAELVGKTGIFRGNRQAIFAGYLILLRPICINSDYLNYVLGSNYARSYCKDVKTIGVQQCNINAEKISIFVFPLPPLAEQRRIVEKLETLMPLIERYGKSQEALDKLNAALPDQLRQSILQEAIQGRLVPQDPNEEPASALLERIRREKARLVQQGKLKKKDLEEKTISPDEIPFDLPEGWVWGRIEGISYPVGSKDNQITSKEVLKDGLFPVVSQGQDLIDGYSNYENKVISDIPLVMFGDHTRNVKYIDFKFVIGADGTKLLKPILIHDKYFYYLVSYFASKLRDRGYARHYTLLRQCVLPIPPLAEQRRIVSKLEELLHEIDKLKG